MTHQNPSTEFKWTCKKGKNLIVITFRMINVSALICTKYSHALTRKPFNRIQKNFSKDGKNLIVITFMIINVSALICTLYKVLTCQLNARYWVFSDSNLHLGLFALFANTHTSYLSFFLHWQNFWKIKFTPKNANFSR